jgi:hypothetical protein
MMVSCPSRVASDAAAVASKADTLSSRRCSGLCCHVRHAIHRAVRRSHSAASASGFLMSIAFLPALQIVLAGVRALFFFRTTLPGPIGLLESAHVTALAGIILRCLFAHDQSSVSGAKDAYEPLVPSTGRRNELRGVRVAFGKGPMRWALSFRRLSPRTERATVIP